MKITVYHQVEFNELDPMNVVWHGNYINYFEMARRALLEHMGYTYDEMRRYGYAWPVVKLSCKYIHPATFRQKLAIEAEMTDYVNALTLRFTIRDAETGQVLTKGQSMQMPVDIATGRSFISTPEHFIALVEAAQKKD